MIGEANLTFDGTGALTVTNPAASSSTNIMAYSSMTSGTGSPARLILRTAAGNTADTYMSFHSVDGYEYSIGVDNSDSDIFKISGSAMGTNDKLEIKSDGTVGIHNKLGVGLVDPSTRFHMKGSGAEIATFETTSTASQIALKLVKAASSTGGTIAFYWVMGSGNGSAGNKSFEMGYTNHSSWRGFYFWTSDAGGAGSANTIWRVPENQMTIDANATWDDNAFDLYDDALVLERAFSPAQRDTVYQEGKAILKGNYEELIDMGVLKKYPDDWVGYNDQRMAALLAGGIYQTRHRLDDSYEELKAEIKELNAKITALTDGDN